MKKKLANVFTSIRSFVKSHAIGTGIGVGVLALVITAVIVGLAFRDTTEVTPGGKEDASSAAGSSVSQEPTDSELAQKEAEEKAKAEQEAAEKAAAEQKAKEEAEQKAKEEAEQKAKEEAAKKATASTTSTSSKKSDSSPATTTAKPAANTDSDGMKAYEERVKARKEAVKKYLEENGIDPATAGETGELCPHCGKKIWNANKYGLNNPGYPDDYENSGYCNGGCAIKVG